MKVALDLHDFSLVHNRFHFLLALKQYFPNFKVSLFTIPIYRRSDWGPYLLREQMLEDIRKFTDWIQLIPHGLRHEKSREMQYCSYNQFRDEILPAIKIA